MTSYVFDPANSHNIKCSNCIFLIGEECHRYPPVAQHKAIYRRETVVGREFILPVALPDEFMEISRLLDDLNNYPVAEFPHISEPDVEFCGEWRSHPTEPNVSSDQ